MNIPKTGAKPQQKRPKTSPRETVLVLAYADGWIEVYAERHVSAKIVLVPSTGSVAGEVLAERYLDETLPYRYREVHWPGKLRAADKLRTVRPSDMARRDHDLALLHGLQAVERSLGPVRKEGKVWTL